LAKKVINFLDGADKATDGPVLCELHEVRSSGANHHPTHYKSIQEEPRNPIEPKDRAISPRSYYLSDLSNRKLIHKTTRPNLCKQLLDSSVDRRRVSTTDHLDLLAVLEEEESGHSGDLVLGGNLAELVNVDLVELDAGVLLAQLLDCGRNGLAGTAPLGEEVDEDGLLGVGNLGLEVLLTVRRVLLASALIIRDNR